MSRRASEESLKSNGPTSLRKYKHKIDSKLNGEFSWEKYLQQTGGKPAPPECFKHSTDKNIKNKFEVGQKLEAKDARNPSAISVATIVQIQGLRLCLRLDGTDGCNDFWRLVDSEDIFPLGTCEAHGGLLQPPLGFTKNVSTWPLFLNKTLTGTCHADQSSFYPEAEGPEDNFFEVGMKLEAVDKKNPHLICPATIGDIDEDQVFISFDGWRGTFDYWTSFQSRDIFPVGWCSKNNHLLQSPGSKGDNPMIVDKIQLVLKQQKRQTRSVRNSEPVLNKTASTRVLTKEKPQKRRRLEKSGVGGQQPELSSNNQKSPPEKRRESCSTNSASSSSDESETSVDEQKINIDSNQSGVNISTSAANHKESNVLKEEFMEKQTNDIEKQKQERKLRKQKRRQRRLLKALKRAGTSEDKLTSEQIAMLVSPRKIPPEILESELIKANIKKKKKKRKNLEQSYTRLEGFGVKENSQTPLTPKTEVPNSPSFFSSHTTPSSLFGVVREATQGWPLRLKVGSVVTSDNKLGTFNHLSASQEKSSSEVKSSDVIKNSESVAMTTPCVSTTTKEPHSKDDRATPSPSVSSTTNIGQTNYLSDNGAVSSTTNIDTTSPLNKTPPDPQNSFPLSTPVVSSSRRSRNPLKWSIVDTIDFVREKEPALHPYLHLFQKHEIDGTAFLLLSSSNIVKYMALKLGPALKLTNLVESLKSYVERHKRKRKKV